MTVLVRGLEQDGLVGRTPDPDDARATRIAITEAGRVELAQVRAARAASLRRRLEALDPTALETLAAATGVLDDLLSADPSAT
jgi:DNA-binding MarR family transcriptional regulator